LFAAAGKQTKSRHGMHKGVARLGDYPVARGTLRTTNSTSRWSRILPPRIHVVSIDFDSRGQTIQDQRFVDGRGTVDLVIGLLIATGDDIRERSFERTDIASINP
jgi:hypothetical protein